MSGKVTAYVGAVGVHAVQVSSECERLHGCDRVCVKLQG